MSCDCAQGYNQPAVNKSPCGCQRGYSGPRPYGIGWLAPPVINKRTGLGRPYGMAYALGGPPAPVLMGDITQGLGPVDPGAQFAFGFNYSRLTQQGPGASFLTASPNYGLYAQALEQDGISYGTSANDLGGSVNAFISIQGFTNKWFASGTDLGNAIFGSINARGYAIDPNTIQFCVQLSGGDGSLVVSGNCKTQGPPAAPPAYTPTPEQVTQDQSGQPAQTCDWSSMSFGQWLSCELGFSSQITAGATTALLVGAGLLLFVALKK